MGVRLIVVNTTRGAPVDHIADILLRVGIPSDGDMVSSGRCHRGNEKSGGKRRGI